ncbi:rRNA maturation RNase YbeY [Pseudidiomarina sp. 1APR75-15]|uniref:Endoribonuclease YbeY n=1 Tax=Pseudidiomarina terrestris TaxID=2820060 RepID=A0ABT8MG53_9GAMM|nr:rRNA maturation RNase YbeY [Pseudidiomarina sp. 1APR75-15]MDN7128926.1 rRNA maturation RNase YbeY [Pseudidiomarina sp. 1APR75-15]
MTLTVDLQVASNAADLPTAEQIERWVAAALAGHQWQDGDAELTVRVVDETEGRELNRDYRERDYATNVLSFPFTAPIPMPVTLLGDLVVCAPVVAREAAEQDKTLVAHWAHMIVHGTLHLLGYDHIDDAEAEHMERLETTILIGLGFVDPYEADAGN